MDIDILKSLVAVAETGSFSRAATSLCVSQSAVSKRIKLLEDKLGQPLLDRTGVILKLTSAGKVVEKNARSVIDICTRCSMELDGLKAQKKIVFRCTPSYGISYLPYVTKALMEQRPDITSFSLSFDNLDRVLEAIKAGICQLAVVEHCDLMPISDEHRPEHLDDDVLVLVGAPSLGIAANGVLLEDLLPQTLYTRSKGCCSREVLEFKMQCFGHELNNFGKVMVCDDLNMILRSLISGYGIGYLAKSVVAGELNSGTLQIYDVPGFEQIFHRSLLVGNGFVTTNESQDLIQIIRSVATSSLTLAISCAALTDPFTLLIQ